MKILCYAFQNQKGELEAPFLEYLEKYSISDLDSEKQKDLKTKKLMNIKAHLEHLIDNKGKYNIPSIVQKYKEKEIGILKIKESGNLVRIAFFTQIEDTIILLDAFDKPKLYEKQKKKKINTFIQKFLNKAEEFKSDYITKTLSIPLNL